MKTLVWLVVFTELVGCGISFYLPGLAPKTYCTPSDKGGGDREGCENTIKVFVNRLDSEKSVLPFDYKRFPFCPAGQDSAPGENLGQVLFGERITPAPLELKYNKDEICKVICQVDMVVPEDNPAKKSKTKSKDKATIQAVKKTQLLMRAIQLNYQQHWIADNLPAVFCYKVQPIVNGPIVTHCDRSFPIGCYINGDGERRDFCNSDSGRYTEKNAFYLFNHLDFIITYHPADSEVDYLSSLPAEAQQGKPGRITDIRVTVSSFDQNIDKDGNCEIFQETGPKYFQRGSEQKIEKVVYSYSVTWQANTTIKWSSRWDHILNSLHDGDIQWFQILNSLVVILFMSGAIATILWKALRHTLQQDAMGSVENMFDKASWKLVHGDVFRPPTKGMLLSVFLGNGVQFFLTALITLLFACLGFLSPANRGFLMTCAVVCYVLMGTPAGYSSARIYKMFGGDKPKTNAMLTAFLAQGLLFGMFFLLNLILWGKGSSAAVPFGTLVAVLALWFCVSAPLTFLGAYFGFKRSPIENPTKVRETASAISMVPFYLRLVMFIILGGILPFGSIFLQLFFILNSIWSYHVYYMFGFLFLVFVIFVITCSEVAILLCFFQLQAKDYHWWWRSFMTTGFTAVYLFIYCIHFFVTKMAISGTASTFLFFGYTIMMVFVFFLISGCIGFYATFWFVRTMYSTVTVDNDEEEDEKLNSEKSAAVNSEQINVLYAG